MDGKDNRHKARFSSVSVENIASGEGLRAGTGYPNFLDACFFVVLCWQAGLCKEGSILLGTGEYLQPHILHFFAFIDQLKSMNAAVPSSGSEEEWQRRSIWFLIHPSTLVKDCISLSQYTASFSTCDSELRILIKYKLLFLIKKKKTKTKMCTSLRAAVSTEQETQSRRPVTNMSAVPAAKATLVCMLCAPVFMTKLLWALWALKGVTSQELPGSSHCLRLQRRLLEGAVSGTILADLW